MTNDKQIEAALAAYKKAALPDVPEDELSEWVPDDYVIPAIKAAIAAIEASHAQYVPQLVEALKRISAQNKTNEMPEEQLDECCYETGYHGCIDEAQKALAALPEELRKCTSP